MLQSALPPLGHCGHAPITCNARGWVPTQQQQHTAPTLVLQLEAAAPPSANSSSPLRTHAPVQPTLHTNLGIFLKKSIAFNRENSLAILPTPPPPLHQTRRRSRSSLDRDGSLGGCTVWPCRCWYAGGR